MVAMSCHVIFMGDGYLLYEFTCRPVKLVQRRRTSERIHLLRTATGCVAMLLAECPPCDTPPVTHLPRETFPCPHRPSHVSNTMQDRVFILSTSRCRYLCKRSFSRFTHWLYGTKWKQILSHLRVFF